MAGHTTGGRSEKSDEVTAIPLKKRNGCHRSGRRNSGRILLLRKRGQLQERNDRHGQRLPLILGVGGDRSRRNRGGRPISRDTTRQCLAILAITGASLCHLRTCARSEWRQCNGRTCHQDKSQKQRDRNSQRLQCHAGSLLASKPSTLHTLAYRTERGKTLIRRLSEGWPGQPALPDGILRLSS